MKRMGRFQALMQVRWYDSPCRSGLIQTTSLCLETTMRPAVLIFMCLQLTPGVRVSGETARFVQLEHVAARLVFYQNEGNSTLLRDSGELASAVQTVARFEFSDPDQTLDKTKLTYTWDFGNGEVIEGTDPVVRYNYTQSGNYTLRLQVGPNVTKQETPIAGVYSMDLHVLDVIRNIEMEGPSNYQVAKNVSMVFHADGSLPMWACLQVVRDCRPVSPASCPRSVLYSRTLRVNHTFTSTGLHCLVISVHNDVSSLHSSVRVHVGRPAYSNLLFITSCLAVLAATFSFIAVIACRPRYRNLLTAGPAVSAVFLQDEDGAAVSRLSFSGLEWGERQPLVVRPGPEGC